MSCLLVRNRPAPILTRVTEAGGETHRCRDEPRHVYTDDLASQAELLAPTWRDQVGVLAVPGDPVPHERAVGQDHQVPLPGGVQARLYEPAGDALGAEPVVDLSMRERDLVAAQVVLGEPGQLAVRENLEPILVRIVGNL